MQTGMWQKEKESCHGNGVLSPCKLFAEQAEVASVEISLA